MIGSPRPQFVQRAKPILDIRTPHNRSERSCAFMDWETQGSHGGCHSERERPDEPSNGRTGREAEEIAEFELIHGRDHNIEPSYWIIIARRQNDGDHSGFLFRRKSNRSAQRMTKCHKASNHAAILCKTCGVRISRGMTSP